MSDISLRFYEELNDFLPRNRQKRKFTVPFRPRNSIKDMVESVGVPHTEIDLILVNGHSMEFSYIVQPDDQVSIYPVFEALDISEVTRLRPEPLRHIGFVSDTHLGKLTRYLRLLGFDILYSNLWKDDELAEIAACGNKRVLLTRDHGLLKRSKVTHGYFIRNDKPALQIREVLAKFDLYRSVKPFTCCIRCNGLIHTIPKNQIIEKLPDRVSKTFDKFSACDDCKQIYWQGSHYDHMQRIIDDLLGEQHF